MHFYSPVSRNNARLSGRKLLNICRNWLGARTDELISKSKRMERSRFVFDAPREISVAVLPGVFGAAASSARN